MKPFDLEKALTGEPVKLRDGSKAYVKYVMPEEHGYQHPLVGYLCDSNNKVLCTDWTIEGKGIDIYTTSKKDITAMWEEPRPRVQLDLPCPLKAPQEGMWYIPINSREVYKSGYCKSDKNSLNEDFLENGFYFATEEDAQKWLDAMRNARR